MILSLRFVTRLQYFLPTFPCRIKYQYDTTIRPVHFNLSNEVFYLSSLYLVKRKRMISFMCSIAWIHFFTRQSSHRQISILCYLNLSHQVFHNSNIQLLKGKRMILFMCFDTRIQNTRFIKYHYYTPWQELSGMIYYTQSSTVYIIRCLTCMDPTLPTCPASE